MPSVHRYVSNCLRDDCVYSVKPDYSNLVYDQREEARAEYASATPWPYYEDGVDAGEEEDSTAQTPLAPEENAPDQPKRQDDRYSSILQKSEAEQEAERTAPARAEQAAQQQADDDKWEAGIDEMKRKIATFEMALREHKKKKLLGQND
ncbi:uncharacterized protein MYCFIDRAFT_210641 [Pseudocercospora fijiensis CIRAD86]|uniref:Uncharacterized protein n=1 Tax=Pseudocercospora fijiensis (strain CIRAD86) TaxID=383855 RepID=M3A734_PSEFD|nr:uncharacterized protein MYCFIDRAFT_210641 [Pseudocercospora fijiensis CIRAD86]EME86899.1 hypothetical protein MYCFIDRAFT_210641 [Pseudocercospora fijiensis CIRAD86]